MTPDELISGQLDGTLDDAGAAAFDAWLAADRANQVRWCQAVMDHQHLRQRGVMAAHATTPSRRHLRLSQPRRMWIPWAAVAAALLVVVLGWWALRPLPDDTPVLALAEAVDAQRPAGGRVLSGERLQPGDRLNVGAGSAVLRYADGTRITIAAGSVATVLDPVKGKRLRLDQGDLSAEVSAQPSGRPLVVSTAAAEVVVVGTTLSIASTDGETRVGVSSGAVRVERGADTVAVPAGSFAVAAMDAPLLLRRDDAPIGQVHAVGVGQRYPTLTDLPKLNPGDVVELHPGTHRGGWKVMDSGTALRPLVIRGIRATGTERPVLDGSGQVLDGVGQTARAVLQLHGSNVVVEHLTITNGRNGRNAAGIRCVDAQAITIRDCRIRDCDQGIDAAADRVLIEDNDIGPVGTPDNDGYCHLLHLSGGAATVRGNLLHDATHGQALMSANRSLVVEANRISGCADGEMSFLDSGRERSIALSGNLLIGMPRRAGANRIRTLELYGTHGGDLRLSHNTIIAADGAIVLLDERSPVRIVAEANILLGSPHLTQSGKHLSGTGNLMAQGAVLPPGFGRPWKTGDPLFVDPAQGDYRLHADVPVIGGTVTTFPAVQPKPTASPGSDPRTHGKDPGAFMRH